MTERKPAGAKALAASLQARPRPSPQEWYVLWRDRPRTRKALKLLRSLNGSDEHQAITLERIARACFEAAHYSSESDPGSVYRKAIAEERGRLKRLEMAARTLRMAANRREKSLGWAMELATASSGVRVTRLEHAEPQDMNVVAERYFEGLELALKRPLPELHGGPFLHRHVVGNLIFESGITAGRPVELSSMLAFDLTLYLRMFTAGRATDSTQLGQPMAQDGSPCYAVVAAFVAAVLERDVDANKLQDALRRLKGVGLGTWGNPIKSRQKTAK